PDLWRTRCGGTSGATCQRREPCSRFAGQSQTTGPRGQSRHTIASCPKKRPRRPESESPDDMRRRFLPLVEGSVVAQKHFPLLLDLATARYAESPRRVCITCQIKTRFS